MKNINKDTAKKTDKKEVSRWSDITFNQVVNAIANLEQKEFKEEGNKYAQKRNLAIHKPIIEKYNEIQEDLRDECAQVDEKGFTIYDEKGNYKQTPASIKNLKEKARILSKQKISKYFPDYEPYVFREGIEIKALHPSFKLVWDFLLPQEQFSAIAPALDEKYIN
jgi:hypothetical protein